MYPFKQITIFVSYIFLTGLHNSTLESMTSKGKDKAKIVKLTELKNIIKVKLFL